MISDRPIIFARACGAHRTAHVTFPMEGTEVQASPSSLYLREHVSCACFKGGPTMPMFRAFSLKSASLK